jgi:transcriptional regulator with XRE-family HTH domain
MPVNLLYARFCHQKTQNDLSLLTGIAQPTLSLIERGYQQPSAEQRKKIADALGVILAK